MNLARINGKLIVRCETVGIPNYDFDFDLHFPCSHPSRFQPGEKCVLRVGPVLDYRAMCRELSEIGLAPVNSPEHYARASELEGWYPRIPDLTPRSRVVEKFPDAKVVEEEFGWPVFVKGSRQTSRHNPESSVIASAGQYEALRRSWDTDAILRWQKPAFREFVQLAPVAGGLAGKIRPSCEFRSFWWHGTCVGWGQYWFQVPPYDTKGVEAGLAMASEAARRLEIPFLVIDFAKKADGTWTLIECNDGQESGYAAINPFPLWRAILERC